MFFFLLSLPIIQKVTQREIHIIGRREYVALPGLALEKIEAKVDTGAYTSSIHCESIEIDGDRVHCVFLDPSHPSYTGKKLTFEILKKVTVRSSNGMEENRVMIGSEIVVLGRLYRIKLTLTDRSNMNFPLLLGRKFLKNKFLVDVNRIHQNETVA